MNDIRIETIEVIEFDMDPTWSHSVVLAEISKATGAAVTKLGVSHAHTVVAVEHAEECPTNAGPDSRDDFDRCACSVVFLHVGLMNDAARDALDKYKVFLKPDAPGPKAN